MMIEKGCLQKQKLGPIKKNFSNLLRPDTFKLGHLPTSFCLYLSFRYLGIWLLLGVDPINSQNEKKYDTTR